MISAKAKILLIEDDPNLGYLLQENLELNGFEVERYADGEEGWNAYLQNRFDLCLIDVMLPRKDGFTLAEDIRRRDASIPIIFLTAKSLKEDRITGFKIGGDDYVTKPFSMEELVLRIEAVLKRTKPAAGENQKSNMFALGKYQFDYDRQNLQSTERSLKLTHKEAELLRLLCTHMNETLEREVALKLVWGEDNYFNGRSMDVFVSKLRKYFKDEERIEIRNVHGRGFKLVISPKRS